MISKSFHYLILLPLSILPSFCLYFIADLMYVFIYYVIGYRKKIVTKNIQNSLLHLTHEQQLVVIKKFYKHLCDIMVESVKSFTISKKQLAKRFIIKNPELADSFAQKNKSIIIVGGHYNNWEMFAQATPLYHQHNCLGIYKPLSNDFYNAKMLKSRQKFGFNMFAMKETLNCFKHPSIKAIFFASDQSPSSFKNVYWLNFLNQETAVQFGVERLSKLFNYPILTYTISKVKRGYYQAEYELLCDNPTAYEHGEITKLFTSRIQEPIFNNPEYWLWSHKRWKKKKK